MIPILLCCSYKPKFLFATAEKRKRNSGETMAMSFLSISSPTTTSSSSCCCTVFFNKTSFLFPPLTTSIASLSHLKNVWGRQLVLFRVKCVSEEDEKEVDSIAADPPNVYLQSSSPTSISAYNWCAALGGLGFLETSYLTFLKLTDSDVFCPIGGGSCTNILNSDYAVIFGVPLPLIGMIAYGLVTAVALQLAGRDLPFRIGEDNGRLMLLGTTTSMATASTYFLYILSTKFTGESCTYCLVSALLSFSLLFTSLKASGLQEVQKIIGLQLCIAGLVVTALSTSYNNLLPLSTSMTEPDLKFFTTEITTESTPLAISLAKHLHSIGAKMYGAFWCSHCVEQKQMFGKEAAKHLDYIECFPDGYRKGVQIAKACANVGIEGFPTWVINGQVLNGELDLSELAQLSGFKLNDFGQLS